MRFEHIPTSSNTHRAGLDALIARLAIAHVRLGWRPITESSAAGLLPDEAAHFPHALPAVLNRSGAARALARRLLADAGLTAAPIGRQPNGAPIWPPGVCGSLAHDDHAAVAVVASSNRYLSLGIDIEPDTPLPPEIVPLVATPAERARYAPAVIESRILFVAKEAAFKASWPLDGAFLDFADIEIDLDRGLAHTTTGRAISLKFARGSHILALAHIPA